MNNIPPNVGNGLEDVGIPFQELEENHPWKALPALGDVLSGFGTLLQQLGKNYPWISQLGKLLCIGGNLAKIGKYILFLRSQLNSCVNILKKYKYSTVGS